MLQDDHTAGAPQLAITPLNNVAKVPTTHNGEGTRLKNSLTRSREKQVNKPSRRPPRGSQTKNPETTTTKFSQQIPSDIPQAQGATANGAIRRTIDHLVDKNRTEMEATYMKHLCHRSRCKSQSYSHKSWTTTTMLLLAASMVADLKSQITVQESMVL